MRTNFLVKVLGRQTSKMVYIWWRRFFLVMSILLNIFFWNAPRWKILIGQFIYLFFKKELFILRRNWFINFGSLKLNWNIKGEKKKTGFTILSVNNIRVYLYNYKNNNNKLDETKIESNNIYKNVQMKKYKSQHWFLHLQFLFMSFILIKQKIALQKLSGGETKKEEMLYWMEAFWQLVNFGIGWRCGLVQFCYERICSKGI